MSVATIAAAKIKAECRWAKSAVDLIGRVDRQRALLARADEIVTRQKVAEQALQDLLAQPINDFNQSEIISANVEYEKFVEYCDAIGEEAFRVWRETTNSTPTLKLPILNPTQTVSSGLPKIDLFQFNGNKKKWLKFISSFDTMVDLRSDLSPSQKMEYLISHLIGKPLETVSHLVLSDENYPIARNLLATKYHIKRQLADTHVRQILGLPNIIEPCSLKTDLLDPVICACNGLMRLGLPVDQWSFILLHIVLTRIPQNVKKNFELKYGGDGITHFPLFKDLLKFLEECRLDCNAGNASCLWPSRKHPNQEHLAGPINKRRMYEFNKSGRHSTYQQVSCLICHKLDHTNQSCPLFLSKTMRERKSIVTQLKLCYKCLGQHLRHTCRQNKTCSLCQGDHLELICNVQEGFLGSEDYPSGTESPVVDLQPNQGPSSAVIGSTTLRSRRYSQVSSSSSLESP